MCIGREPFCLYADFSSSLFVFTIRPRRLLDTRSRLYDLLCHCIPADVILKVPESNIVCVGPA